MPEITRKPGKPPVLEIQVDECSQCYATIEVGRDYCPTHEAVMQRGLERNCCGFCDHVLPPIELRDGFCPNCGCSLVNPPPITGLKLKAVRREPAMI